MSTYVISDLHGAYDAFMKLLDKINFSAEDTLYILGDVVDRGKEGVRILQYVMETPNIRMLIGNHEFMCLQFFRKPEDEVIKRRWNRNGNFYTLAGFDQVSPERKEEILDFIDSLPSEVRLEVNGKKFILVHGFLGENRERQVWNRPAIDEKTNLPADETLIIGHTPVCEFVAPGNEEDLYVYSRELTLKGDHFRIFHAESFIDIDCCIGYGLSAARIACLRLDDGEEIYQENEPER